jgi:hypothetical protein
MRVPAKQLQMVGSVAVAYSGTSIALDIAAYNEFVVGKLTGDVAFTFSNAALGQRGVIWLKADAVGGWRAGFTAPAGFLITEDSTIAAEADIAANAIVRISYALHVLDGQNYVELDRSVRVTAAIVVTYNGATVKRTADRVVTS